MEIFSTGLTRPIASEAHTLHMRTPSLPKRAPWAEADAAHLEKVLATFPAWNSEQIAVARRTFGAAQARIEAEEIVRNTESRQPKST